MELMKYRNKIGFRSTTTTERLITDRAQEWRLLPVTTETPLGNLYQAHPSDLRRSQIDYLQIINQAVNPEYTRNRPSFYWAYQSHQGYLGQNHDVVISRWHTLDLWVLMTFSHTFFAQTSEREFDFSTELALPAITERETQDCIWQWRDSVCLQTE